MIDEIAVIVPAADEADELPSCLAALAAARQELRASSDVLVRILVVLDACTDASAEIVALAPGVEALAVSRHNVGAVRAAGADHVLRDRRDVSRLWLANTDADSRVPSHWLREMLAAARSGADLVLGTVRPEPHPEVAVLAAWRDRHVLSDGHPHVHAANLGVRADVYRAIGGWAALRTGEDVDLVRRALLRPDLVILRSGQLAVATSSRLVGRAPDGFAEYLRALPNATATPDELVG